MGGIEFTTRQRSCEDGQAPRRRRISRVLAAGAVIAAAGIAAVPIVPVGEADAITLGAAAPSIATVGEYLVIGTKPMDADHAVNISQNEMGADRAVITSDNGYSQAGFSPTVIDGQNTNVFPRICYEAGSPMAGCESDPQDGSSGKASRALIPDFDSVFQADPSAPTDPSKNSWFPGAPLAGFDNASVAGTTNPATPGSPGVDYLPYTGTAPCPAGSLQARTFRGVDWSGNIAVTAPTGIFALSNTNLFANYGVRSTSAVAGDNISGSYYYPQGALTGTLMDTMDIGGGGAEGPNAAKGWVGPYDHTGLVTDLRAWRIYLRSLSAETTFTSHVQNESTIKGSSARVTCYADTLDVNNDGIILVDLLSPDVNNFFVSNSDWVIDGSGNKLIVFRLRDGRNMQVDNSSIMIGNGLADGGTNYSKIGVIFAHVHPEEEFTSTSGSSDTVFTLGQSIMNGIAMWDLNTINPASTDTDYAGQVDRGAQGNYTNISHNNTQGCGQFIAPRVNMQNVRWVRCVFGSSAAVQVDFGDLPDDSSPVGSPASPGYNTDASGVAGPSHTIVAGLRIGSNEDAEVAGQPNATATGDDTMPVAGPDDEDGVTVPTLTPGSSAVVSVSVSNTTVVAATLCGYIDFDGDGLFTTAGEAVSAAVAAGTAAGTVIPLNFAVPSGAVTTNEVGARFRLSTVACAPDGSGGNGEVEDLLVQIVTTTYAIGNFSWIDVDSDGVQDGDENPAQDVVVRLFDGDDNEIPVGLDGVLGTTDDAPGGVVTTNTGTYYFDGLPAGSYYVTFTAPGGFVATTDTPQVPNEATDSDPDPLSGRTATITLDATTPATTAVDPVTLTAGRINRDLDAGFVPKFSLGNRVWLDADNTGDMNGAEAGKTGVIVNLLDVNGAILDTTTTVDGGFYRFDALDPGDYVVELAASNFVAGGALFTGISSTGAAQESDPNDDIDVNDNGLDTPINGAIRSGVVALGPSPTAEPAAEMADQLAADGQGAPDRQANMTVDFGVFIRVHALGDSVWEDFDNDGLIDVGEAPFDGVTVRLLMDDPQTPGTFIPAKDVSGSLVADAVTAADGSYSFPNLLDGIYKVVIPRGQPILIDYVTSGTPDPIADNDEDGDNNGVLAGLDYESGPVTLGSDEPTDETDGLLDGTPDADATTADALNNASVDFGFFAGVRVGNIVWLDGSVGDAGFNNGVVDAGEPPLPNVTVELWADDGNGTFDPAVDSKIAETLTNAEGNYWFEHLEPGQDYFVAVATIPGEPAQSSTGGSASATDADNTDDGAPVGDYLAVASVTAATAGTATLGELDAVPVADGSPETEADTAGSTVPDSNSELTVDLGFIRTPVFSLGKLVWEDFDRDGLVDPSEAPIPGVTVELSMEDPANPGEYVPAIDVDGVTVADQLTTADGAYLFTNLPAGDYKVVIPAGQPALASFDPTMNPVADADNDVDGDSNGVEQLDGSLTSGVIVLGPLDHEPTNEVDGLVPGSPDEDSGAATDPVSNLSVDFGLFRGVRIGNLVWKDGEAGLAGFDNGVVDAGELPIGGVSIGLFEDDGDGIFEPLIDVLVTSTVSDTEGNYWFEVDPGGKYFVAVESIPGPASIASSTGQASDPSSADNVDDGAPLGGYVAVSGLITAPAPTAAPSGESDAVPAADGSAETEADAQTPAYPDTNSDLRIDLGFIGVPLYRIGNLVWRDDGDGIVEAGEAPIEGVTVELHDANGVPIDSMVTGADGKYNFENLVAGDYEVRIAIDQTPLLGLQSSPVNEAAANDDGDNNDNGTLDITRSFVTSGVVTVGNGDFADEPTTESDVLNADADDDTGSGTINDDRGNLSIDLGFSPLPLAIGDYVWYDLDHNGAQGITEDPVVGATVRLFEADGITAAKQLDGTTTVPTETTDVNGFYLFDNLAPGSYVVTFTHNKSGYRWTESLNASAALDSNASDTDPLAASSSTGVVVLGHDAINVRDVAPGDSEANGGAAIIASFINRTIDAGVWAPVAVGDVVWSDIDGDGLQGLPADEPGVPGVTVTLQLDGVPALDAGGLPAVTTTGVDGSWVIDDLFPGTYTIEVTGLPDGWLVTESDAGDDSADSDINPAGVSAPFTLAGDAAVGAMEPNADPLVDALFIDPTIDAGVFRPMSVGDLVFRDADGDGIFEPADEVGVVGVTVELLDGLLAAVSDADGAPVTPVTTDPNGRYSFANLVPGEYVVRLTLPDGMRWTVADTANDSLDSDAAVAPDAPTADVAVTLDPFADAIVDGDVAGLDVDDPTIDAGVFTPVSVGDLVWNDVVNDGVFDPLTESGVVGASVRLLQPDPDDPGAFVGAEHSDGSAVLAEVTDGDGRYQFADLAPGAYAVEFTLPSGMRWTTANVAGDDTLDSDAGFVTVADLTARSSTVTVVDGGDAVDSDISTSASNATDPSLDAGVWFPLAIGDVVWVDSDRDGINEAGESPVDGAAVRLTDEAGEPVANADGDPVGETTTNVDGCYAFDNLAPGTYLVEFEHGLAGYRWTIVDDSDATDATDSDATFTVETNAIAVTEAITLTADAANMVDTEPTHGCGTPLTAEHIDRTVDAGVWAPVAVGDRVWLDANKNGAQDDPADEPGVEGVTVTLYRPDGTTVAVDADGAPVAPVITGPDGSYLFDRLVVGQYVLGLSTLPESHSPTDPNQTTDDDDSDVDPNTARSGSIELALGAPAMTPNTDVAIDAIQINRTVDAGVFVSLSVGDLVWYDENRDGTFNPTDETGVEGVTVTLLGANLQPVATDADGDAITPLTTDVDGRYAFTNLKAGTYAVRFTLPDGYEWTVADAVAAGELLDSDARFTSTTDQNATTATRALSILAPLTDVDTSPSKRSATDPGFDAGIWRPMAIGDKVFVDVGEDGLQDSSARPLAGVTVKLFATDGTTPATDANGDTVLDATTDADGLYLFDNLLPGTYVVEFEHGLTGMRWTTSNAGDDALDSDALHDVNTDPTATVMVELREGSPNVRPSTPLDDSVYGRDVRAGLINPTVDAGVWAVVAVGDQVWIDHDYDGVRDTIDTGVPGVTVRVLTGDGLPVTDADGGAVGPMTTTSDGTYLFDGLKSANYIIEFTGLPAGHAPTKADEGGDDTLDSDPNEDTVRTAPFYLDLNGALMEQPDPADGLDAAVVDPTRDLGLIKTPGLTLRKYATVEGLTVPYDPTDPATLGCDANSLPDDGSKPDDCQIAEFGGVAIYRIVVTNTGYVDLTPPRLTDRVQSAPLVCENMRRIHPATVGNVFPVGAQWVYQCEVSGVRYNFTNEATAEAEPVLPDGTPVVGGPTVTASDIAKMDPAQLVVDMGLTKELVKGPLADGSFQWEIDVTNLGPDVAWGSITIIDDLPAGFEGNVSGGEGWTCTNSGPDDRRITCTTADNIEVNATSVITVNATLTAPLAGDFVNEAYFAGKAPLTPRNSGNGPNAGGLEPAPAPTQEIMNPSLTFTEEQGATEDSVPIPVFDLATTIVYVSDTAGNTTDATVTAGSTANFNVTVVNQGNTAATAMVPAVHIPVGLQLNDPDWQLGGSIATSRLPIAVAAGATIVVPISVSVTGTADSKLTVWSEIASATSSGAHDDRDSTPDRIPTNDRYLADNDVTGNGLASGDEDDHDPAFLTVTKAPTPRLPLSGSNPFTLLMAGATILAAGVAMLLARRRSRRASVLI